MATKRKLYKFEPSKESLEIAWVQCWMELIGLAILVGAAWWLYNAPKIFLIVVGIIGALIAFGYFMKWNALRIARKYDIRDGKTPPVKQVALVKEIEKDHG